MAYTPHTLFAFGGSWSSNPEEVWECTVRLDGNGGGGVTLDPEAYLASIATPMASWFSASVVTMDALAQLKWLKCNNVNAEGRYTDTTTTHVHDYSPAIAGSTDHKLPGFCSLAYTWETAVARGPGHRGRIYPPNATMTTTGAFTVSDSLRTQNAQAGAQLLNTLKNLSGPTGTRAIPVVASKIGGAIHAITGCTSDNVFDVQRRRKNRIKGARSAVYAPV